MEYCNQSLSEVYNKSREEHKPLEETYIKDIFKQGLQGLKCMHENQMVHLDIKPDNMLFKEQVLKISDMGLARITKIKR
jgi:serine/threonine protein kinase